MKPVDEVENQYLYVIIIINSRNTNTQFKAKDEKQRLNILQPEEYI
jgi:hypothetical protein